MSVSPWVLAKLGLLRVFRDLNNPMQTVRTRRVAADRTQLMTIDIKSLIRDDPVGPPHISFT
jgi:hypothetical protein